MRRVTFTADEVLALCHGLDDPCALDDDDYANKFATEPGTAEHERYVAAYRTGVEKLRAVNRRRKSEE